MLLKRPTRLMLKDMEGLELYKSHGAPARMIGKGRRKVSKVY
jgi:hypothetical protein